MQRLWPDLGGLSVSIATAYSKIRFLPDPSSSISDTKFPGLFDFDIFIVNNEKILPFRDVQGDFHLVARFTKNIYVLTSARKLLHTNLITHDRKQS